MRFVPRVEPRFREEYDAERPTAASGYVAYAVLHDRGFPDAGCARCAQETHRQKKEREPGYSADQELSPETYRLGGPNGMRERAVDSELVLLRWSEKQMLGVGKGTGQRAEELGGQGSLAPSHKNERKPEQQSVQRDQVEPHFVVLIERFVVADRVHQEVRDECRRDCFPAAPEHHGAACPHSSMNKRDHLSASITDRLSRISGRNNVTSSGQRTALDRARMYLRERLWEPRRHP